MKNKRSNNRKVYNNNNNNKFIIIIIVIIIFCFLIINFINFKIKKIKECDIDSYINEKIEIEKIKLDIELNTDEIIFSLKNESMKKGVIFVSDYGVSPKAYSEIAIELAKKGNKVFLISNTNNLRNIINKNSDISKWIIGGHGYGGKIISKFCSLKKVKAIFFLASYPDDNIDLSKSNLKVTSIYGSKDNILNKEVFNKKKKYLPEDTNYVEIDNGNYYNFGSYKIKNKNTDVDINVISKKEQQIQTQVQLINLLDDIK